MGWRAHGSWFVWPAILLWVVLWHLGPMPLSWQVRRSYPDQAGILLLSMGPALLGYLACFGAIFGLMHGPSHLRPLWRVVGRAIPLAFLAGVLAACLMYPEGLWGAGPLTRERVLRAVAAICCGGALRAAVFLAPMALGAYVATYRLGRYVLGALGVMEAVALAVLSLSWWWLVSLG